MRADAGTIRASSIAGRVIDCLEAAVAGTSLTPEQISTMFGCRKVSVATLLGPAVKSGVLDFTVDGQVRQYFLKGGGGPAEATEQPAGPLTLVGYHDGDLVVDGATIGEDGRVLFKRDQLRQLVEFATTPLVQLPPLPSTL